MIEARDILDYWFQSQQYWFNSTAEFDQTIQQRFQPLIYQARDGLLHWSGNARGRLALIIVLDQFSRHSFRGSAESFAQDESALSLTLEGMKLQHDQQLISIERHFFYRPLMHSESLDMQELSLKMYQNLALEQAYHFAKRHYEVIKRFGRFPHRNRLLGRQSTQQELQFLQQFGSGF